MNAHGRPAPDGSGRLRSGASVEPEVAPGPAAVQPAAALGAWQSSRVLCEAFVECTAATRRVHEVCGEILHPVSGDLGGFRVRMGTPDPALFAWRRNLFSTVFQAAYHLLELPVARRALFAQLNHLFRVWVTAADNLLDHEDKATLPLEMPAGAQVMRQVVAVMLADRCLTRLLQAALRDGVVSSAESDRLSERTLTVLLPSAALEASEERGVVVHPAPDVVLDKIHYLKTGILFTVPFIALEEAETRVVPPGRALRLRGALESLGSGCQILDDIRDFARDLATRRHNYLSAILFHGDRPRLEALLARHAPTDARLYHEIPAVVKGAVAEATDRLESGMAALRAEGLDLSEAASTDIVDSLFRVLDVEDVRHV